jgi:nicotinate-nucleotide adenylyltransferase
MQSKRIGIYGGAFNPPTLGHTHVIKSVLEADVVDEIWVVPSFIHFHGKQMAPYDVRVKMCEHAFLKDFDCDTFTEDQVKIKKFEFAFSELVPEYDGSTSSMMENLRKHYDEDFYLIIGEDNADSMNTWKNGDELMSNEKFIIIPRPTDNDFPEVMGKPMWYKYDPHTYLDQISEVNMSSTMARSLCKRPALSLTPLPDVDELKRIVCGYVRHDILMNKLYMRGQ